MGKNFNQFPIQGMSMGNGGWNAGNQGENVGTKVGMRGIRVGMRGIRVILCENLHVYCFG